MNLMSVYHWQFFYLNCICIIRIIINGHVMDIIIKKYIWHNGIHEYMKYMNIWNENQCVIESNNIDVSRETFESEWMRRRR